MTNNPITTIRLGILGTGNKDLRSGIIGLGNMGSLHARSVLEGKVPRMRLTAVCDINPERMVYDPEIKTFTDSRALIRSGELEPRAVPNPNRSMIRAIHSPSKFSLVMTTMPRRRKK